MHGRRFRERKRNKLRIISQELFSCGLRNFLFAAVPDPDPIEAADNPHDPDRGQGGGGDDDDGARASSRGRHRSRRSCRASLARDVLPAPEGFDGRCPNHYFEYIVVLSGVW